LYVWLNEVKLDGWLLYVQLDGASAGVTVESVGELWQEYCF